jgi:hypothetical protein
VIATSPVIAKDLIFIANGYPPAQPILRSSPARMASSR